VTNSAMDRLKSKPNSIRAWKFPIPHLCKYPDPRAKRKISAVHQWLFFVGLIKFFKKVQVIQLGNSVK